MPSSDIGIADEEESLETVIVESLIVMVESRHCNVEGGGGGKVGEVDDVDESGVTCCDGRGGHGMEMFWSSLANAGLFGLEAA